MATPLWHDHYATSNPLPPPDPRHSAPPVMQQPSAEDQVVVWDDSMMDLDDAQQLPSNSVAPDPQPEPAPAINPEDIRPEAVHVRGVDNLSTDDVKQYINQLFPKQDFKIEWIDDTSLNVVYSSADIATSAIQALSSNYIESLPLATLRPAKSTTEPKTIDGIKVRIAVMGDKKERGARDRSRWYLFNPHPSEEYDRRRDRRRGGYEPYSRRGQRSRSPILDYDDPPRNTGIELFPQKVGHRNHIDRDTNGRSKSRSRSRSPPPRKRQIKNTHPLWNNIINTVSTPDQPLRTSRGARMDIEYENQELFPSKVENSKLPAMDTVPPPVPLADRIGSSETSRNRAVELFPQKVGRTGTVELFPEKAVMSGKSLLERIQDEEGGGRELFPEKVGGRGRRNRRKAEDHF